MWTIFGGVMRSLSDCIDCCEDELLSPIIRIFAIVVNCMAVCRDMSVLSGYNRAAGLVSHLVGWKTEIRLCV